MNGTHGLASGKASPCPALWAFGGGWQWQGAKTSTGGKVTLQRWSSPPAPEEEFQDQGGGSSGGYTFELVMASGSHGNRQCQIWVWSALAVESTVQLPCCSPGFCSGQSSALPSCTPCCGVGKRVQKLGDWGGPRTRRGGMAGFGVLFPPHGGGPCPPSDPCGFKRRWAAAYPRGFGTGLGRCSDAGTKDSCSSVFPCSSRTCSVMRASGAVPMRLASNLSLIHI